MLVQNIPMQALQPADRKDAYNCKQTLDSVVPNIDYIRPIQNPYWENFSSHLNPLQPKSTVSKLFSGRPQVAIKLAPLKDVQQINIRPQTRHVTKHQPRISSDLRLPSVFMNQEPSDYIQNKIEAKQPQNGNVYGFRQRQLHLQSLNQQYQHLRIRDAKSLFSPVKIFYPNANKQRKKIPLYQVDSYSKLPSTRESSESLASENLSNVQQRRINIEDCKLPHISKDLEASNSRIIERLGIHNQVRPKLPEKKGQAVDHMESIREEVYSNQSFALPFLKTQSGLSLAEMVMLSQNSHNSRSTKRIFHAPTLTIYNLQEGPVQCNEYFEEWIFGWKKLSKKEDNKDLVKIIDCFWDSSQERASVLMEATRESTLQDIIEFNSAIPENCIQMIASCIVRGLHEIYEELNQPHGAIKASEIFFDSHYLPKLAPGIEHRSNSKPEYFKKNFALKKDRKKGSNLYEPEKKPGTNGSKYHSSDKKALVGGNVLSQQCAEFSSDIFDLGYLLLVSALGNLGLYDPTGFYDLENLKWLMKSVAGLGNFCCLLHSEEELRKYYCEHSSTVRLRGSRPNKFQREETMLKNSIDQAFGRLSTKRVSPPFTLLDLLTRNSRFSVSFVDFLCKCLRIHVDSCSDAQQLLNHEFIGSDCTQSDFPIRFRELIQIREQAQPSKTQNQEHQLYKVFDAVTVASKRWNRNFQYSNLNFFDRLQNRDHRKLDDLAAEFGVPAELMFEKLQKFTL